MASLLLGLVLAVSLAQIAEAQTAPSGGGVQTVEPTSPRVGKVRRNAQGVIELVPETAPAATQPEPSPPRSLPAAPAVVAPPAPRTAGEKRPTPAAAEPGRAPGGAQAAAMPACDAGVLLCMRVLATTDEEQRQVPLTFGHPLAPGLLRPGQDVVAKFQGAVLPVQLDQIARHGDGSVRFAVFSTSLPQLGGRASSSLELLAGGPPPTVKLPPIPATAPDVRIELEQFAPQITEVTFGNRVNSTPGIPFKRGETITLEIGANPPERYTLTLTPEMEGGAHPAYTAIAMAFVPLISRSAVYRAHRDAPEVYETLWITSRERPGKSFPVRAIYSGAAKIAVKEAQKWEPRRRYVATLPGSAATTGVPWLDGPAASEAYLPVPLRAEADGREHPALSITVGVKRTPGEGGSRFDVTVDNTSIQVDALRNYTYDATVKVGGATRFEKQNIEHYAAARWHKLIWAGKAPQAALIHDRTRLLESRAVPAYDAELRVSDAALGAQYANLQRADTGPMGAAFIYPRMPTTGGRPDIGPLPLWSALHVLSQDPRQTKVVLANGDASGSFPVHYRDPRSGMPVNVKQYPAGRLYGGAFDLGGRVVPYGWSLSPFAPETSHEPSLTYYPYLLTGDRFHLDELHYWASYNGFVQRQEGRGGGLGLVLEDQVRGQAWSLRTLAHAALITPDRHPLKPLFQEQLRANMDALVKRHVMTEPPGGRGVLRTIADPYHADDMSPWQQDFMAIVVANLAENGVEGADKLLRWMSGFIAGRWMAEGQGYCRANGAGYWLNTKNPKTGARVMTWAEFHKANWPEQQTCAGARWLDEYIDCAACYTTIARAALASLVNVGIAEAREPYEFIRFKTPNARANVAADPTFAIAPRR